jgi:Domain of unknown function (DUF5916)/Carbohydrate family 9 binding domain-like
VPEHRGLDQTSINNVMPLAQMPDNKIKYNTTMSKILFTSLLIFVSLVGQAQQKNINAVRLHEKITIDGLLDEAAWQSTPIATGFVQNSPNPGGPVDQETTVKVLYDDQAIYIGAHLLDNNPDSILLQLTERDQLGNTDWFAVIIDAYQDGQNGVGFAVTASGVQIDEKYSLADGGADEVFDGDASWDAVWSSQVKIVPDGWVVEMSIPYSAIRFPNKEIQTWNINFARTVRRSRQSSYWNPVKPDMVGLLNQSGTISNISNIKSPVRLQATPFLVGYLEHYRDKNGDPVNSFGTALNGGMDVKYGINDAFTIDLTLIPDFGQTRSDNQVLNLSPFEVQFDENRPFFTEGTELFNKGGLFYSRRVGGRPLRFFQVYGNLSEKDSLLSNPQDARLYNATKLSGRTNKGLGIGFFNATSAQTSAKILNKETGDVREFETNPLTNYNVFVLDQNLKNNSSATFINTNVLRKGAAYDANVTGGLFTFRNKTNSYELSGRGFLSQQYYHKNDVFSNKDSVGLGHSYGLGFAKTSGQWQYSLGYSEDSRHYDINDLGIFFLPNARSLEGEASYQIFKPFGIFNRMRFSGFSEYIRLQSPDAFVNFAMGVSSFAMTKKFLAFGFNAVAEPVLTNDYYEPRTSDFSLYYEFPTNFNVGGWVSTDYRKAFAYDVFTNFRKFNDGNRYNFNLTVSPRYRVNDHLSFILDLGSYSNINDIGYVAQENGSVILGRRDVQTFEHVLNSRYIFNNKMSVVFRLRHYWSVAEYHSFHALQQDGRLGATSYNEFNDNSFNAFNIDMEYRWRFAPGSDIFFVWKSAITEQVGDPTTIHYRYGDGVSRLPDIPQRNSFSIKFIYFLDYLAVRGWFGE